MKPIYSKIFFTVFLVCLFSCQNEGDNTDQSDQAKRAVESGKQSEGQAIDGSELHQMDGVLSCNIDNYQLYIHNRIKTEALIKETGEGCQLENVDFQDKSLVGAIFIQANLNKANLPGADFADTKLQGADLDNAIHDASTNFKGAEYDNDTDLPGWDIFFSAKAKGMVKEKPTSRRRWKE